ncbi:MAG TPA: electron transport complex subunit RsxB [Burkholderiaceae bacterium]|nr:electron transport complex subunit RsxB [Burkholderiaceae bacterium]
MPLVDSIDALLPQTQCTQCGYDGCRPYATAIAQGEADINRCPPGGQEGVNQLAELLGVAPPALDTSRGLPGPLQVAIIDEAHCIGCTLCIQACPVDAIVGANQLMHTVLSDQCTGCELCVAPCPVDCISMVAANREWTPEDARAARRHHEQRHARLDRQHTEEGALAARTLSNKARISEQADTDAGSRQQVIADALAQARARRQSPTS